MSKYLQLYVQILKLNAFAYLRNGEQYYGVYVCQGKVAVKPMIMRFVFV